MKVSALEKRAGTGCIGQGLRNLGGHVVCYLSQTYEKKRHCQHMGGQWGWEGDAEGGAAGGDGRREGCGARRGGGMTKHVKIRGAARDSEVAF